MRIWKINPRKMCRQHLLGEHLESHMFASCIRKNKNINGHIEKGQIEIHNLRKRHEQLAGELKRRGYKHKSPVINFKSRKEGKINIIKNYKELSKRCKECRRLIERKKHE